MDVRCERCSTEYEFDDALVSGRGTTVKCTNCGHKFKIRRSDGDFSEDFWNVQTGDGRTLVFTSLRELQRAIQTNLVDRHDLLSRGGLKQKAIGQIPELAPFFEQRDPTHVHVPRSAPPPAAAEGAPSVSSTRSSRPPPPPGAIAPQLAPPRQRMSTRPDYPPPVPEMTSPSSIASMKRTLMGTGEDPSGVTASPPPAAVLSSEPPVVSAIPATPRSTAPGIAPHVSEPPPPTEREPEREPPPETQRLEPPPAEGRAALTRTQPLDPLYVPRHTPPPPAFEASSPLPPPAPAIAHARGANLAEAEADDYESSARGPSPSLSDSLSSPPSMGKRRSVGGFIVAAAVIAGVALIGAVWAKDNLRGLLGGRAAPVVVTDPRVASFLEVGEKALADGNLETAKESFDKASALAEKDPRVLLDAARLAAVRADTPWLKSRLLAPDAADEHRLANAELAERSAAARKAADDALAVSPDDAAALRAKIDALRIVGDRAGARALVAKVAPSATQPETAYVLATLDLAESEPLWSTVIERLRIAASAESGPGRARASLAYALARSGDVAGAKAEVERLAQMPRQHPLLPLLRSFADKAKPLAKLDPAITDGGVAAVATDGGRAHGGKGEKGEKGGKVTGDARQLVAQGEAARARGDNDRAQTLFAAALDRNPNDAEALNGLAAIAHSRRDLNGARASYKRVLSINPSYVPALVGVADVDWESGDRTSAMKTYKEIVDRFPEGSYPARVRHRVDAASGNGNGGAAPTPAPPSPSSPAPSDTGGGG